MSKSGMSKSREGEARWAPGVTGIRLVRKTDRDYPEPLRHIHDPPEALYWRGSAAIDRAVAVVGTRKMSPYGRLCAGRFASCLSRLGIAVVSGLALGIDGAAHEAALAAGGKTAAVLGSGVDDASVYPRAHLGLARRILEAGGAVLSEYPAGTPSYKDHFPARNRIVAGLCEAVLVVEAPFKSGAMITARLALETGRDVWVVPGPVDHANAEGVNRLLRQGALPVTREEDIAEALGLEPAAESSADGEEDAPLLAVLREAPADMDELAARLGRGAAELSARLTALELRGAIRELDDGRFALYTSS